MGLQLLDDLRRRRPRQAEVLGGAAETAQLDDAGEQAHGLETIHDGLPDCLDVPNSVGESGPFINPGNAAIINGIFLLHHCIRYRQAPSSGCAGRAPHGANRSRFHPAHPGVRGVFLGGRDSLSF